MERKDKIALYRQVFGTPPGKKVLDDLMNMAGLLDLGVDFSSPEGTYFLQGQRNVGLYIHELINDKQEKKRQQEVKDELEDEKQN